MQKLPDTGNINLSKEAVHAIANRTGHPKGLLKKTEEEVKKVSKIY